MVCPQINPNLQPNSIYNWQVIIAIYELIDLGVCDNSKLWKKKLGCGERRGLLEDVNGQFDLPTSGR